MTREMLLSGPMLGLLDFRPAQILVLGLARDHDYRRFSKGVRSARGRVHRPAGGVPRCSPLLESPLDPEDIERRVAHAHNLITTSERLLLVDPAVSNIGLIIWQAITNIPPHYRSRLLPRLSPSDIRRLWKAAGFRYDAPQANMVAAGYSVWEDFPLEPGEIVRYGTKMALQVDVFGLFGYDIAFFRASHFDREDFWWQAVPEGSEKLPLYGRALHKIAAKNWTYPGPMYFDCSVGSAIIPDFDELCDLQFTYLDPPELGLALSDVPDCRWCPPRRQLRPFDKEYVEYVRVAGPGVLVGMGLRTHAQGSGLPLVPSPLFFAAVRMYDDS